MWSKQSSQIREEFLIRKVRQGQKSVQMTCFMRKDEIRMVFIKKVYKIEFLDNTQKCTNFTKKLQISCVMQILFTSNSCEFCYKFPILSDLVNILLRILKLVAKSTSNFPLTRQESFSCEFLMQFTLQVMFLQIIWQVIGEKYQKIRTKSSFATKSTGNYICKFSCGYLLEIQP